MRTASEIREEMEAVRAAMRAIIAGAQSYRIGSREVTRADLAQLRAWLADDEAELAAVEGSSVSYMGWLGR